MTATHIGDRPKPERGGRIVLADPGDARALTEVITSAFFTIAPWVWLFPDPAERRSLLPRLLRQPLDDALEHGTVYTTEGRCAAAVWFPRSEAHSAPRDEQARVIGAVADRHADRIRAYDAVTENLHPAAAHDYLWAVAVHPDHQRAGIGSAMLEEHHRLLDARGRAAYLEASDTGIRSLSLRLGYRDLPAPRIVLPPPEGCVLYGMWRPPCCTVTDTPSWLAVGDKVRVRAEVSDWGGSTGIVAAVKLQDPDRPVLLVLDEDKGPEPDARRFAVAELEPIPADSAPGAAPARERDAP